MRLEGRGDGGGHCRYVGIVDCCGYEIENCDFGSMNAERGRCSGGEIRHLSA